jgi:glycosyltransferase involved in cell wall biosynthesis
VSAHEPCLSVVIPAYNEAATVLTIINRVLASPYTAEVIVVDDGSTDDTGATAQTVSDPRLRVILHPQNRGKGAALRSGFAAATAPIIVVQDADLEYNPEDWPALLGPILEGKADVVYGSRFFGGNPHRVLYFWHYVGNRLLTVVSNAFTNVNLTDMETCYKMFRRDVLQSLTLKEERFGFEPEVTARVAAAGYRIWEVGISYTGRTYAEGKKIGWKDGVRALYCVVKYGLTARRSP